MRESPERRACRTEPVGCSPSPLISSTVASTYCTCTWSRAQAPRPPRPPGPVPRLGLWAPRLRHMPAATQSRHQPQLPDSNGQRRRQGSRCFRARWRCNMAQSASFFPQYSPAPVSAVSASHIYSTASYLVAARRPSSRRCLHFPLLPVPPPRPWPWGFSPSSLPSSSR